MWLILNFLQYFARKQFKYICFALMSLMLFALNSLALNSLCHTYTLHCFMRVFTQKRPQLKTRKRRMDLSPSSAIPTMCNCDMCVFIANQLSSCAHIN